MTTLVVTIGPAHTLRQAARLMSSRRVGAAVVVDPEYPGVGILTERDVLDSLAVGQDPDTELAAAHRTLNVVYADPESGRCRRPRRSWSGQDSVTSWW